MSQTIGIAELLGRQIDPVYGQSAKRLIEDRTVLVTGAGGSIGSEIVRQLQALGARRVVCLDRDEYALYQLQLKSTGSALLTDEHIVLADILNPTMLDTVFGVWKPEIVIHAAAHKHLPLLERAVASGILTNVEGTDNVARACIRHGVGLFVNISTDKAAQPTSVLGATKRLAEMAVRHQASGATRMASVRFGNVFGSRGSFIETLGYQIREGKPISVTHEDVTRYFMAIPEAAGLVIEAAVMATAGETYVLDMGRPYRILDIIRRFAQLSGKSNPVITFTGLREGEKLHEELFDARELRLTTDHPSISSICVDDDGGASLEEIRALCALAQAGSSKEVLRDELMKLATQPEMSVSILNSEV